MAGNAGISYAQMLKKIIQTAEKRLQIYSGNGDSQPQKDNNNGNHAKQLACCSDKAEN
jgi:exonuclease VII small subunit